MRDFQDAQDQRYSLYRTYSAEIAQPTNEDRIKRLEDLKAKISDVDRRINELGIQVQAAFPRYNQLVDSVIEAKRVIDLINPGEALLQILLGTEEGMVFLVSDETVRAFPLDLSLRQARPVRIYSKNVVKIRLGLKPTESD